MRHLSTIVISALLVLIAPAAAVAEQGATVGGRGVSWDLIGLFGLLGLAGLVGRQRRASTVNSGNPDPDQGLPGHEPETERFTDHGR
ncbi:MAG: hypothetical protein Q4G67_06370 [Actinomycetia bacterium]|nr:hypothetical protein [Actinomycetes bacterium]